MRFRLLLFCLPIVLGACSKTNAPVQLDFIGNSTLTSGSKIVGFGDTLTTRAYAVGNDYPLKRLRIQAEYKPGPQPILYPSPLSGYDPNNAPQSQTIVYLDSLITPVMETNSPKGGEYLFQNRFSARATSGSELWQYTASDAEGQTASRAYQLTVRKTDSAAVFHSYTVIMRPPPADSIRLRDRARVFLNLGYGLLLPRYAVLNNESSVQGNQQLIDLICTVRGTNVTLDAPAYSPQANPEPNPRWPNPRATKLYQTQLRAEDFNKASTIDTLAVAPNSPQFTPDKLSTGTLAKNQVVAFKTVEGKAGLLLVSDLVLGTAPVITCIVKVQK